MSVPKINGQQWYERCRSEQEALILLGPRDEIDLASFVLDRLVDEVANPNVEGDSVIRMLIVIRDRTKSVKNVVREVDNFVGRLGTPEQRAHWKRARSAVA